MIWLLWVSCSCVCSTSAWVEPRKVIPPLWLQDSLLASDRFPPGMKHLRCVYGNSLTARFPSFDGNKSLCFLESNMTWNIPILTLSKPWVLLLPDKTYLMSPHPLPTCSPSLNSLQRRMGVFSSRHSQLWLTPRTSWDGEMMQKEQENLGLPIPLLHSLAPSSPMLWGI